MRFRDLWSLYKDAFTAWRADKAERLAAALSYYTLFSIAPLLIVAVAIAGLVFGPEAARGQIAAQFRAMLGDQAAGAIQAMIANAYKPSTGIIATIIGIVTLLIGAAGVFGQIQDAFNTIWHVKPKEHSGVWDMIKSRFLSFAMVLGVGFILLVSLVLSATLAGVSKYLGDMLPGSDVLWRLLELASSFFVVSLLFAMLYKVLPDTEVQWRDVLVGALSSSALFTLGKYIIGLYLGRSSVASAYGAAGSLVVLLLWIYYAAQILFFGAAVCRAYAERFGSRTTAAGPIPAPSETPAPRSNMAARSAVPQSELGGDPATPGSGPATLPGPVAARTFAHPPAAAFGKEIRVAGLIGAALGVVIGFLRPAQSLNVAHRRKG